MTRNIVMGVVLIILLAVAGYIFYDRNQKQNEADQQKTRATPAATRSSPTIRAGTCRCRSEM